MCEKAQNTNQEVNQYVNQDLQLSSSMTRSTNIFRPLKRKYMGKCTVRYYLKRYRKQNVKRYATEFIQ